MHCIAKPSFNQETGVHDTENVKKTEIFFDLHIFYYQVG